MQRFRNRADWWRMLVVLLACCTPGLLAQPAAAAHVEVEFASFPPATYVPPDFYSSLGIVFDEAYFNGFSQGANALQVRPLGAHLLAPVTGLSLMIAPVFQGTFRYDLTAYDTASMLVGSETIEITQDIGVPGSSPPGYFEFGLGDRSVEILSFRVVGTFIRSSDGAVVAGRDYFAVRSISYEGPFPNTPVPAPSPAAAAVLVLLAVAGGLRWRRARAPDRPRTGAGGG